MPLRFEPENAELLFEGDLLLFEELRFDDEGDARFFPEDVRFDPVDALLPDALLPALPDALLPEARFPEARLPALPDLPDLPLKASALPREMSLWPASARPRKLSRAFDALWFLEAPTFLAEDLSRYETPLRC